MSVVAVPRYSEADCCSALWVEGRRAGLSGVAHPILLRATGSVPRTLALMPSEGQALEPGSRRRLDQSQRAAW